MVVRFVCVGPCARVCPGSPRCLFTGIHTTRTGTKLRRVDNTRPRRETRDGANCNRQSKFCVCPGSPVVFLPVQLATRLRHCCIRPPQFPGRSPRAFCRGVARHAIRLNSDEWAETGNTNSPRTEIATLIVLPARGEFSLPTLRACARREGSCTARAIRPWGGPRQP